MEAASVHVLDFALQRTFVFTAVREWHGCHMDHTDVKATLENETAAWFLHLDTVSFKDFFSVL